MKKLIIVVSLMALVGGAAFAALTDTQVINLTLNTIATMRILPDGAIALVITDPVAAGDPPAAVPNSDTYIQYTVVSASAYRVTVTAAGGPIPTGTLLTVTAEAPVGATGVAQGTTAGAVTITVGMGATNVLTNIQNCYTGVTATSGSNLTYNYSVNNLATAVPAGPAGVTLTYTIQL